MDRHGITVDLIYQGEQLYQVTSPLAGTIQFNWNSKGRIESVTRLRDNLTYTYQYDAEGRLARAADFDGRFYNYTYVKDRPGTFAQNLLASITDPLGRTTTFTYYDDGRARKQFEPGGGVRSSLS